MGKMSVLIPSRNEQFLIPTIQECFTKAGGDVEVVAVLEGYWPENWKDVTAKYPNLHTIYHSEPKGLRTSINDAAASAISRGAKFLFKLDAHCLLDEGYDVKLQADIEPNWIVIPRRLRLDAENWCVYDDGRPPIDYHYLSFPDNVKDFGGPGLNGKVWVERAKERFGKSEYDVDEELSSQGSAWMAHAKYFEELELMDFVNYGQFWCEAQELGFKAWLSGGKMMVNKKTTYAHLHKGSKYGRGYHLPKEWLSLGATFTKKWLFNEAWAKQTLPFKTLIERFWPVPTWPENWEELVYGEANNKSSLVVAGSNLDSMDSAGDSSTEALTIHSAHYGINNLADAIDVTYHMRSLVQNGSLDVVVTNDSLKVGNPFRGQKKRLRVVYSYDGGEEVTVERDERDWLIIGQSARYVKQSSEQANRIKFQGKATELAAQTGIVSVSEFLANSQLEIGLVVEKPSGELGVRASLSAPALTDFLIRKFQIPSHRLRGPMPIEVPTFHRNDLAQLFAELGFNKGCEVGVAEGNYSEILVKANPQLELLCVDPWHAYSGNPQNKSKEKNEYAYREAERKLKGYNVKLDMRLSMDAVRDVADGSLDWVYIDAMHSFNYVLMDIICWSAKVRSGGLIVLDDYYYIDRKRWGAGVVEAVQAYTSAHEITPWFIFNGHKSVEACWVNP